MPPPTIAGMRDDAWMSHPLNMMLAEAAQIGAERALSGHQPKLTVSRTEAAEMLGLGVKAVDAMVGSGELVVLPAGRSRITLASVLRAAGWPVTPAPIGAPLSVVPTEVASAS